MEKKEFLGNRNFLKKKEVFGEQEVFEWKKKWNRKFLNRKKVEEEVFLKRRIYVE